MSTNRSGLANPTPGNPPVTLTALAQNRARQRGLLIPDGSAVTGKRFNPKTSIDVSDCLLALYRHPHPESEFACADSLSGLSQLAPADASADAGEAKK